MHRTLRPPANTGSGPHSTHDPGHRPPAAIAAAAALFEASYSKVDADNGHDTWDHSVKSYLVGADQHLFAMLDFSSEAAVRRHTLDRLLSE